MALDLQPLEERPPLDLQPLDEPASLGEVVDQPLAHLPSVNRNTVTDALQYLKGLAQYTPDEGLSAPGPSAQERFQSVMEEPSQEPSRIEQALSGGLASVNRSAESLTTPKNLLLAATGMKGPAIVGRGIAGYFGLKAAEATPELYQKALEAHYGDDTAQKAEAYSDFGLNTLFGLLTAAHAGKSGLAKEVPALRQALVKRVQTEYSPEQLREMYGRVTRGEAAPEEVSLFQEINQAFESPGKAIRQGVTQTQESPRFPSPVLNKWLGIEPGTRTFTSPEAVAPVAPPESAPAPLPPASPQNAPASILRRQRLIQGPEPVIPTPEVQNEIIPQNQVAPPSSLPLEPLVTTEQPAAVEAQAGAAQPQGANQALVAPAAEAVVPQVAAAEAVPESRTAAIAAATSLGIPDAQNFIDRYLAVNRAEKNGDVKAIDPVTGKEFTARELMQQLMLEGKPEMGNEFSTRRGYTKQEIKAWNGFQKEVKNLAKKGFNPNHVSEVLGIASGQLPVPEQLKVFTIKASAPAAPPPSAAAPAPLPLKEQMRQLVAQQQAARGWNPKWPFVEADLLNPTFREGIRKDPTLSDAEKAQILKFGDTSLDQPPVPPIPAQAPAAMPVVRNVFHFTTEKFKTFDPSKIGSNTGHSEPVAGFYLTENPKYSGHIAEGSKDQFRRMDFQVAFKNPLIVNKFTELDKYGDDGKTRRANIEAAGYDGVIAANGDEVIAFAPEQITQRSPSATQPASASLLRRQPQGGKLRRGRTETEREAMVVADQAAVQQGAVPTAAQVTEPVSVPSDKYRVGTSPQPHTLMAVLTQSEIERQNNEQPVQVRNDKTGVVQTVMQSDLTPIQVKKPQFSAAPRQGGLLAGQIEQFLAQHTERTAVPVVIVQSATELPQMVQDSIAQDVAGGDSSLVRGVIFQDQIYFVADNIGSVAEIPGILAHELVGHYGVEDVLGHDLQSFMEGVTDLYANDPMRQEIERLYVQGRNAVTPADKLLVGREIVARLAQDPSLNPSLWQRLVAWVQAALRKLGLNLKITEADIRAAIKEARERVKRPQPQRPPPSVALFSRIDPENLSQARDLMRDPTPEEKPLIEALVKKPNDALFGHVIQSFNDLPQGAKDLLLEVQDRMQMLREFGASDDPRPLREQLDAEFPNNPEFVKTGMAAGFFNAERLVADRKALSDRLDATVTDLQDALGRRERLNEKTVEIRAIRGVARQMLKDFETQIDQKIDAEQDGARRAQLEADRLLVNQMLPPELMERVMNETAKLTRPAMHQLAQDIKNPELALRDLKAKYTIFDGISEDAAAQALAVMRANAELYQQLITIKNAGVKGLAKDIASLDQARIGNKVDVRQWANKYAELYRKSKDHADLLAAVNRDVSKAVVQYINHGSAYNWLNETIASPQFAQNYADTVKALGATTAVKTSNGIEATYVNPNDPDGKESVTIKSAVDLKTAQENAPKLTRLAGWMQQYLDEGTDPVLKLSYQDALVEINDLLNNAQMSPKTGNRLTRSMFDISRLVSLFGKFSTPGAINAYLGGEAGQRVRRDSKNYSEAMARVMNQFGDLSNDIQTKVGKAAKAHGMTIDEWNQKINRPILESYMAAGDRHLGIEDSVPGGHIIKQQDMSAVDAQSHFIHKLMRDIDNLPEEIKSFVSVPVKITRLTKPLKAGGRVVETKAIPLPEHGVPRTISIEADQIAREWKQLEETYANDPVRLAQEKIRLINDPKNYNIFLSYFRTFSDPSFIVQSPLKDSALQVSRDINVGNVPSDFDSWSERLKEKESQKEIPVLLSKKQIQGMVLADLDHVMRALNQDRTERDSSPTAAVTDIIDAQNFMNRPRGDTIALKGMYDLSLHDLPSQMQRASSTLQVFGQALLNSWRSQVEILKGVKTEMEREIQGDVTRGDVYRTTQEAMEQGKHFYKLKELDGLLTDLTHNINNFSNKEQNLRAFQTQALSPKWLRIIKSYAISGLLMRPAVMANNFFGGVNKMNQMDAMLQLGRFQNIPIIGQTGSILANTYRSLKAVPQSVLHGISAAVLDTETGKKLQEAMANNPQAYRAVEKLAMTRMIRWAQEYKRAEALGLYNYAPFFSELKKRWELRNVGGEIRGHNPTKWVQQFDKLVNALQIGLDTGILALRLPSAWFPGVVDAAINYASFTKTEQLLGTLQLNILEAFHSRVASGEDPKTIRLTPQEWFNKPATANMEQEFTWLKNLFAENDIDLDTAARNYYQRVQAAGPRAGQEWLLDKIERNGLSQTVAAKLNRATWMNRPQNLAHDPMGRFFMSLWGYALNENAALGELLAKSARNPRKWADLQTILRYALPMLLSLVALGTLVSAPLIDQLQEILEKKKRSRMKLKDVESKEDALKVIGMASGPLLPTIGQVFNSTIQPDAPGRGGLLGGQINLLPLSLANSVLQLVRQIGGTGEVLRPLLQFNAQWNPSSNMLLNRTEYMEGWQAMQNDVATQRSHTPSTIELKKQSGGAPAQYSPVWGQYAEIKNELGKENPDMAKIDAIRAEGIQKLTDKGAADPAKSFDRGLLASANKYLTIYGRELTQGEKDRIDAKKTPEEKAESDRIDAAVQGYAARYGEPIPDFVRQTKEERAQNKALGIPSNRSTLASGASEGTGTSPSSLGLSGGAVGGGRTGGGGAAMGGGRLSRAGGGGLRRSRGVSLRRLGTGRRLSVKRLRAPRQRSFKLRRA